MPTKIPYADASCIEKKMRQKNPNWRGGKHLSSHGYVKILIGLNHHLADSKGYAYEHRLMAEQKLGRRLKRDEKVHHLDGNKTNNAPENIKVVVGNFEHYFEHRKASCRLRKPHEANPFVSCQCGCGMRFHRFDNQGRPRCFVSGHNMRLRNGQYANSLL